jgi:hypothetical protein
MRVQIVTSACDVFVEPSAGEGEMGPAGDAAPASAAPISDIFGGVHDDAVQEALTRTWPDHVPVRLLIKAGFHAVNKQSIFFRFTQCKHSIILHYLG